MFRKLTDPDLIHSTKLSMFLNLVFQALKRDDSVDRQRAFVKRILQVSLTCPPPLACGFLYLTSELLKLKPELKSFRQEPVGKFDDDDDEEEHYVDADDQTPVDSTPVEKKDQTSPQQQEEEEEEEHKNSQADDNVTSTWVHRNNTQIRQTGKGYDPMARNPMYARAELSGGFWELQLLAEHNHPSVFYYSKCSAFQWVSVPVSLHLVGGLICQNDHGRFSCRIFRRSSAGFHSDSVFRSLRL